MHDQNFNAFVGLKMKSSRTFRVTVLTLAFLVTGCESTKSRQVWKNHQIPPGKEGMYQRMSERVLCGNVAKGEAPMPASREYLPTPSRSYQISGQVTGGRFEGTATPTGGFSSGFANGYNTGMAIRAARERAEHMEAYENCLVKLGWVKQVKLADIGGSCKVTADCEQEEYSLICKNNQCVNSEWVK